MNETIRVPKENVLYDYLRPEDLKNPKAEVGGNFWRNLAQAAFVKLAKETGVDRFVDRAKTYYNAYKTWTKYDAPVVSNAYKAIFKARLRNMVRGENYLVDKVYEASERELDRKGAYGFWESDGHKTVVNVPSVETAAKFTGTRKNADNVKRYVEAHERAEANTELAPIYTGIKGELEDAWFIRPSSPEEHPRFEALLLETLGELAEEGDQKAREAYIGALTVYATNPPADWREVYEQYEASTGKTIKGEIAKYKVAEDIEYKNKRIAA